MESRIHFETEVDSDSDYLTESEQESDYQLEITKISDTTESASSNGSRHSSKDVSDSEVIAPSVESFLSDHVEEYIETAFRRDYTKQNFCVFVVDSPEKSGSMLTSKITYRVHCVTSVESFPTNEITVRRSFSDAKWLRYHLKKTYPHCIIPPLVNIKTFSQTEASTALIISRRKAIQRFLNRVGAHIKLSHSKVLHLFLTGDGKNFKEIKHHLNKSEKAKAKRIASGGFKLFSPSVPKGDEETYRKMKVFRKEITALTDAFRALHQSGHELAEGRKASTHNLKVFSKQFAKFNTTTQLRYPSSKINTKTLVDTLVTFQGTIENLKIHEKRLVESTYDALYEMIKDWTVYFKEALDMIERYEKARADVADTQTSINALKKKLLQEAEENRVSRTQQWLDKEDVDDMPSERQPELEIPHSEQLDNLERQLKKEQKKVDRFVSILDAEQASFDRTRANEMRTWTRYFAELSLLIYKKMAQECEEYIVNLDKEK